MNRLIPGLFLAVLSVGAVAQSAVPAYQNVQSQAQSQAPSSEGVAELYFMVEELKREVRQLRGQVEEQQHRLEQLRKQARERYIDLDQRLLDLARKQHSEPTKDNAEPTAAEKSEAVVETREYRPPSDAEKKAYQEIMNLIREKKDYSTAIDSLYDFISEYPEGDRTVNAYYWLGEVYLAIDKLEQAKQAFSIVSTRFDDHRKGPDALYKLGVVQERMGEPEAARTTLKSVSSKYPGANAASLAEDYLEELGSSGS